MKNTIKEYIAQHYDGSIPLKDFIIDKAGALPASVRREYGDISILFAAYLYLHMEEGDFPISIREYTTPRDEHLYYDSDLWRLVEVPQEYQKDGYLPVCLTYHGPVIDGNVPCIPEDWADEHMILYRTWAGVNGLRHNPGLRMRGLIQVFDGCEDFDAFEDIASTYIEHNHGGWAHGHLYEGVKSPKLLDSTNTMKGLCKRYGISYANEEINDTLIEELNEALPYDAVFYLLSGHRVRIKHISKSSEIDNIEKVNLLTYHGLVISSAWDPVRIYRQNITLYFLSKNFVNDVEDTRLFTLTKKVIVSKSEMPSIKVPEDGVIEFTNNCTIKATDSPCLVTTMKKIVIKGHNTTLRLVGARQQPCIGVETSTGLSYGRWSIGRDPDLEEVVLEDINIVCESAVPNFSMGTYGKGYIPKITCKNASISCPELKNRVLVQSGFENVYGSTKSSASAVYEI